MPLDEAQLYFNYGDTVSGIEVMVTDPEADLDMLPALTQGGGPNTRAVPWQDINSAFFEAVQVEAQCDVPDPVADHPGGGAEHRVGPDHAGEGQVAAISPSCAPWARRAAR